MAVLLVGHGSEISPESSVPIRRIAGELRDSGDFAEVHVAFWKEEPYLHQAFDRIEAPRVVVVPVFTSEGYFTTRLVPRELGLDREGRGEDRVRVSVAVGTDPRMAEIVLERAREAAPLSPDEEEATTLVVVGHGTERHPESGQTTIALVEAVRRQSRYRDVVPAFLDQEPSLDSVLAGLSSTDRIVVPFFIAEGWHAGMTIPRDLDIEGDGPTTAVGRLWYAKPVGTHPRMVEVIRGLVDEASRSDGGLALDPGAAGECPARLAKGAFLKELEERTGRHREFLEVAILSDPSGSGFELRHFSDTGRPAAFLRSHTDPGEAERLGARTAGGKHRPLRTAPNLPDGWRISGLTAEGVWVALEHLYPAAAIHEVQQRLGTLSVTPFRETAARHTGMYAGLDRMDDSEIRSVAAECCRDDRCLRVPRWVPGEPRREGGIPCPEACPVLLSQARAKG